MSIAQSEQMDAAIRLANGEPSAGVPRVHRRQLTDPQRALVAGRLVPMFVEMGKKRMAEAGREGGTIGGRGNKKGMVISPYPFEEPQKPAPTSRDKAAALMNVSPSTTGRAMRLLEDAPDLVAKVVEDDES